MIGLDSLGTLPCILNYSEILKYSIELEIQESINSLYFCIQYSLLVKVSMQRIVQSVLFIVNVLFHRDNLL